jgi:hypothetical protein
MTATQAVSGRRRRLSPAAAPPPNDRFYCPAARRRRRAITGTMPTSNIAAPAGSGTGTALTASRTSR